MNCTPQALIEASKCLACIPPGMQSAVQTMLMCEWREGGGGEICDDPVVLDWLQRIANDFQPMPSVATINAVCDFCEALRIYGIMDKMLVVNPVIPDTLLAMRYPLINDIGGYSPWINHLFVDTDLTVDGLLGQSTGLTTFMDTGDQALAAGGYSDDYGITVQQSDVIGLDTAVEFGAWISDDDIRSSLSCWYAGGGINGPTGWSGQNAFGEVFLTQAEQIAFYSMSRTATNVNRLYWGRTGFGVLEIDNNLVDDILAIDPPNIEHYFMAEHEFFGATDQPINISNKRVSFVALHAGLTQAETDDFFEAVQTMRIAFGGGNV